MFVLDPPLDRMRAVCPRCRRLVRPGGACEVDQSEVFELDHAGQRERMIDATWGPLVQREALRKRASEGLGARRAVTGAASFATMFGFVYAVAGDGLVSLLAGALGAAAGAATASRMPLALIPGAAADVPAQWPRIGSGRIVHGDEIVSPGSGTACAAWVVELRYHGSWGARTTLRAGATLGLEIVLDGGARVRIPAGPLWIAGTLSQLDGEDALIDELLRAIDPDASRSDWKLFPFNIIAEQVFHVNDRVDVLGVVEPRPIANDGSTLYREAPPTELVHLGLPVLRRA